MLPKEERLALHLEVRRLIDDEGKSGSGIGREVDASQAAISKLYNGPDVGAELAEKLYRAWKVTADDLIERHQTREKDPTQIPAVAFLSKVGRLPGLATYLESIEGRSRTVAEVARVLDVYERANPEARSDGQPIHGWNVYFDDALANRLKPRQRPSDLPAAEAAERRQLPEAARRRIDEKATRSRR